jgi:glycosyltransferase involved in cell wall biosynthesis
MIKILKIRMRKNPIISVIIPTYQEEKYIEPTLIALSNQTLKREKYEIIISDANSKDNTLKIARKYADWSKNCRRKIFSFCRCRYNCFTSNA